MLKLRSFAACSSEKMGKNPVLLARLYIFDLLPPWDWLTRCTFVLHFQRDNYRFKSSNPVRIVFCSIEPPISEVMLASTMFQELVRPATLFQ